MSFISALRGLAQGLGQRRYSVSNCWLNEYKRQTETEGEISIGFFSGKSPSKSRNYLCHNNLMIMEFPGKKQCSFTQGNKDQFP